MVHATDAQVQTSLIPSELSTLATEINSHHSQAVEKATSALSHARQAGELLSQAKTLTAHGQWLPWLSANCKVSPRQAQRYMQVATNWEAISKNDTVSYLTFRDLPALLAADDVEPDESSECGQCTDDTSDQCDTTTSLEVEYEDCEPEPPSKSRPHVANNSGCNEWYTPRQFIDAAHVAMGGIDLDPASSIVAQETVQARKFYTLADDGLKKKWAGNVWLNPPYAQPLIGQFCDKLVDEYSSGQVSQAIVLTNNATETAWFQTLLSHATAVCFPCGRIRFNDHTGKPTNSPVQGQLICYFGRLVVPFERFVDEFSQFGKILRREGAE